MKLNWSNVSDEELRAILTSINIELTARDNAKSQKLINAIGKAIKDFRTKYPTASTEDYDGVPYEFNLFECDFDTDKIIPEGLIPCQY